MDAAMVVAVVVVSVDCVVPGAVWAYELLYF